MEVSDSLQALPFELNPDQYSALVEEFHNCAADFLKDLPYAKVTATEEEIGSFLDDDKGFLVELQKLADQAQEQAGV